MLTTICKFIVQAVIQGMPMLFGATGEIITEKAGNLNLGIPGIMYMGGISGVIGAYFWEMYGDTSNAILTVIIPLLTSIIGSALVSLIYAFLTCTLKANQNVTGLALTTFGTGIGNFFGGSLTTIFGEGGHIALNATGDFFKKTLPFAKKLGLFGTTFLSYGFLMYLGLVIAFFCAWYLKKSRPGLNLRAVGENPATADAAGINVTAHKYLATICGGAIAGLGGLYFIMDYVGGSWTNGGFGDRGWLAIALVIFALWKPNMAVPGSIIFGGLYILYLYIPGLSRGSQELFKMLPYLVTIIVLIITSMRNKRENHPPASLGLSYFREDR